MKKIKKRANTSQNEIEDPNLDQVDEERAFEVEMDEETNEIVFVMHYRRRWGDDFDADTEHALNTEEASHLIGTMINMIEYIKKKTMESVGMNKSTPSPIEGNPMRGPRVADIPGTDDKSK